MLSAIDANAPTTVPEMMRTLNKEWRSVRAEVLENLYQSMPERIQAVIKAEGDHTR